MVQVIRGQVPSKSNSYRIITINGHGSLAKSKKLKDYEKSFALQCSQYRGKNIEGLFKLDIHVFNSSQRPDLDNAFKIVLDCLQACRAIKNDRNCIAINARKFVDKDNPRIEFKIEEI